MDINLTLLGQMITFVVFVWFTMKYVWPPIVKVLRDRQDKIAAGLTAAEQGEQSLQRAQQEIAERLKQAKNEATKIIEQANQRAVHIVEESKIQARQEGERIVWLAQEEIKREYHQTKSDLIKHLAEVAVLGAEKILGREVNQAANDHLVDDLLREI